MYSRFMLIGFAFLLVTIISEQQLPADVDISFPASVSPQPAVMAAGLILTQSSSDSSSSTHVSGRGVRGIVKLVVFTGVLLVSGVGWVIRKFSAN